MSLNKKDRIKKKSEIYSLLKNGIQKKICNITFYSKESEKCRLAIIIPKKIIAQAVKRNKLKRQILYIYQGIEKTKKRDVLIKINCIKNKSTYKNYITIISTFFK